jgi:hypothetical protein
MVRLRPAAELIARCLVYAVIISAATLAVIVLWTQDLNKTRGYAPLVLLLEGGLSLVVGGVAASFAPVIGKTSGSVFHSKPWDAKRQKEAEKTARSWIGTGIFLIFIGFLVSAI